MGYAYKIYDQNGLYFITCTVVQWIDVFTRKQYADIIVNSLNHCVAEKGLNVYGWVIMSNHIHLIVSAKEEHCLSDILRDFKKYTSSQIARAIEANKQESRREWLLWLLKKDNAVTFWQPDNHAKEITTNKFFAEKLTYIHLNPVRAGIVEKEEEYRYSSAMDHYGREGLVPLSYF